MERTVQTLYARTLYDTVSYFTLFAPALEKNKMPGSSGDRKGTL